MKIIPKIIPKIGSKLYEKYNFNLSEGVPRTGLIFYAKAPGMVDIIGLSAAALWAALPVTHRSIYLVDENTLRSAEAIITNIAASEYLNDGGTLVGSGTGGYAQYEDGTSEDIIRRCFRLFRISWPFIYLSDIDGNMITDIDGNTIEGRI